MAIDHFTLSHLLLNFVIGVVFALCCFQVEDKRLRYIMMALYLLFGAFTVAAFLIYVIFIEIVHWLAQTWRIR